MARALKMPFGELGDMTRKNAVSLNVFRLSHTSKTLPTLTTTFESAERDGVSLRSVRAKGLPNFSQTFSGYPIDHPVREDAFGRWEAISLPAGLTLDQVLSRVVSVNSYCADDRQNLILKIKVRFSDSSEITFVRSNIHDPRSLTYDSYYNPNAHFDARTHPPSAVRPDGVDSTTKLKSAAAAFVTKGSRLPAPTLSTISFPRRDVINDLFTRFDSQGNGVLSLAELDLAVSELWPQFNNKRAIMRAYRAADSNSSGVISRAEFSGFLKYLVNYNQIWKAFDGADERHEHKLDLAGFANALRMFEPNKSEREVCELFTRMDIYRSGAVNFEEFAAFMAESRSNVLIPTNVKLSLPKLSRVKPRPEPRRIEPFPAARQLTIPEGRELVELFDRMDPNGNGRLSLAELDLGVIEIFPSFNFKPALMRAYRAADKGNKGYVSRSDFPYFLRYLTHFTNLWQTFATMDSSGDRRVGLQEFLAAAPRFGIDSEADARKAFAEIDTNHGGFILFEEFAHYMAHTRASLDTARFDRRAAKPPRSRVPKLKSVASSTA